MDKEKADTYYLFDMDTNYALDELLPEKEMMEFFETGRLDYYYIAERTVESLFPAFKKAIEEAAGDALTPDYIKSIRASCVGRMNVRIFAIRSKLMQMSYHPEKIEFINDYNGVPLQIKKSEMAELALKFVERRLYAA